MIVSLLDRVPGTYPAKTPLLNRELVSMPVRSTCSAPPVIKLVTVIACAKRVGLTDTLVLFQQVCYGLVQCRHTFLTVI